MNMQNVARLDIPEGEVRTIHDKDGNLIWGKVGYGVKYKGDTVQDGTPTPSVPVAVQTVTGEQTISINGAAYTVNLGSIKLCKIGTYQDYIYKSGGKWYVHEAVGKADLADYNYTVASTILRRTAAIPNMKYVSANTEVGSAIAEKYIIHEGRGMSSSALAGYMAVDVTMFAVNVGTSDTSVNPTGLLYYALATPTDTEITNEALVAQLEAVEQWLTRYGYNATVTGNLPIIIDRTAL